MEFSILLLLISLLAGALTVFAPCIFTFLPIVLGASYTTSSRNYSQALRVIGALALSVFVFSLLLRASTLLIDVPLRFWEVVAGVVVLTQGMFLLFPEFWQTVLLKLRLGDLGGLLPKARTAHNPVVADVLTGFSLGPIFSSCSPTYGFIVAALLQSTLSVSLLYLLAYIIGLSSMLFGIAVVGQALVVRLRWGLNPKGWFKRMVALVFIFIGLLFVTGLFKDLEAWIINSLPFLDVTRIDRLLLQRSMP